MNRDMSQFPAFEAGMIANISIPVPVQAPVWMRSTSCLTLGMKPFA